MMMNCDQMTGGSIMMIGMGVIGLLVAVALLLGIAAIAKYLRSEAHG